jgi:hypothetical protein
MPPADQKAFLQTETGTKLPCLFNPEELQIGLAASWAGEQIPGQASPTLRYGGGQSGKIDVELFFDTTSDGTPVTTYTDELVKLLKIDTSLPGYSEEAQNGRPPWVKFHWGKFHSFKAVLTSLDLRFLYFSQKGEPLRARASLSMLQYEPENDWPRQNPTSGTPKPARSHLVQPGETLDRVAANHYGDPTRWRRLAEANGIRDPFAVPPGRSIDVPTLED